MCIISTFIQFQSLSGPTYKTFIALLDNYESETGLEEVVTEKEHDENWAFLDAIMETNVMKIAHRFDRMRIIRCGGDL